jgi:hypothetical protein
MIFFYLAKEKLEIGWDGLPTAHANCFSWPTELQAAVHEAVRLMVFAVVLHAGGFT